ncbi:MAG: hypothetical protein HYZ11_17055 [Candidatus Tectomicrobia bacterium]|uniref:Uncharacterized protein n=1 Tax=Tectimicrobiota bacterium TaxID=2528274 RepID=A0A932I3P5_UNCTE|nr:hypothetical protein [Candidatus Tectomicrobia bacterium]
MRRPALLLAALLAALPVFPGAAPGSTAPPEGVARFEVEGEALILRGNQAAAQERAVENALRRAVLRAVRQAVGEEGLARYRRQIEGSILATGRDFIRSYRILHMGTDAGGTSVQARLEALVDWPGLDEALRALRLARPAGREQRVLFLVEERVLGQDGVQAAEGVPGIAEERLTLPFQEAGYSVLRPPAQGETFPPSQVAAALRGEMGAARLLGGLCGCRLVVTARAVSERERNGALVALANGRIIRVEDGAVIAIRSYQVRLPPGRARSHEAALAAAAGQLATQLLAEARRAVPPPPPAAKANP